LNILKQCLRKQKSSLSNISIDIPQTPDNILDMIAIKQTFADPDYPAKDLEVKHFLFPAGEVGLKIEFNYIAKFSVFEICARIRNSNDFMYLAMAKNAIMEQYHAFQPRIDLFLPYVPYARQDRVCNRGESFSLKAFADLINSLNFTTVTVLDPHSDVAPALFDRCIPVKQLGIITKFESFKNKVMGGDYGFVSPDAGGNKKTVDLAKFFNHKDFIRADKRRNLATGDILETIVYADDLTGKNVCIADDICDGGKTFIELAKVLKSKGANSVILYVTHGIFSKGIDVLLDAGIDHIYTTNSYQDQPLGNYDDTKITIFNVL